MFHTLISAAQLQGLLASAGAATASNGPEAVCVLDCSFDLANPDDGQRQYAAAHVPGAHYAHLDRDLSGAKTGRNGRHPLPEKADFVRLLAGFGVAEDSAEHTQIVAYDRSGGMFAARAWWLCRWAAFANVAVLDGGWRAWQNLLAKEAQDATEVLAIQRSNSMPAPTAMPLYTYAQLRGSLGQAGAPQLVDARSPDRFRGENETLDPVGGHIPGAVNRFFKDNLQPDGRFKPAETLRQEWGALLERSGYANKFTQNPSSWVHQCGSGVTACHNLLAMEAAGLTGSSLYAGSWSEWCVQPDAPVGVHSGL